MVDQLGDEVDWVALRPLSPRASEVPDLLHELTVGDDRQRDQALHELRDILFDHGGLSLLAEPATRALLHCLALGVAASDPRLLHLLRELGEGGWAAASTPESDLMLPPSPAPPGAFEEIFGSLDAEIEVVPLEVIRPDHRTLNRLVAQHAALWRDAFIDPRPHMRVAALRLSVGTTGMSDGPLVLQAVAGDTSPLVRASAVLSAGQIWINAHASKPHHLATLSSAQSDPNSLVRLAAVAALLMLDEPVGTRAASVLAAGLRAAPIPWLDFPWEQRLPWSDGRPAIVAVHALARLGRAAPRAVGRVLARELTASWQKQPGLLELMVSAFTRVTLTRFVNASPGAELSDRLTANERQALAVLARAAPPLQSLGAWLPRPKDLPYFLSRDLPLNRPLNVAGKTLAIFRQFGRYACSVITRSDLLTALCDNLTASVCWSMAKDVAEGVYAEPFRATVLPPTDLEFLDDLVDPLRHVLHDELLAYGERLEQRPARPSFAQCAAFALPLARSFRARGAPVPSWLQSALHRTSQISTRFAQRVKDVLNDDLQPGP